MSFSQRVRPGSEAHKVFKNCIILGDGLSARLAAIALTGQLDIASIVGPQNTSANSEFDNNLTGKSAHSHIFLPRLRLELERSMPEAWRSMQNDGLKFQNGSNRLPDDFDPRAARLFSTRWQLNDVVRREFYRRVNTTLVPKKILGCTLATNLSGTHIRKLQLADKHLISIDDTTLVIDATGANSRVWDVISKNATKTIDSVGNVSYVTQFFRLNDASVDGLPDPLIECSQSFGECHVTLYPGMNGWFSISAAVGNDNNTLIKQLRQTKEFIDYTSSAPSLRKWIESSRPIEKPKIYVKPRNRWRVSAFQEGSVPTNYVAIGDALVTTLPTFGAGCSFAATHVRVLAETLRHTPDGFQMTFANAIDSEQYSFFSECLHLDIPTKGLDLKKMSRVKLLKKRFRQWTGADKNRIQRQLVRTSSLP